MGGKFIREIEYLDHTADIKVRGIGNNLKRAIEAFLLGILNIIYDILSVDLIEEKTIKIYSETVTEGIFKLGNEILDVFYIDKFAIGDIKIKHLRRVKKENKKIWYFEVKILGEIYNKEKHGYKKEVKALTYHNLKVIHIKKGLWAVEGVVDI